MEYEEHYSANLFETKKKLVFIHEHTFQWIQFSCENSGFIPFQHCESLKKNICEKANEHITDMYHSTQNSIALIANSNNREMLRLRNKQIIQLSNLLVQ